MANFHDYWLRLIRSNKSLIDEDSKMTISVSSFKKQLKKSYQAGTQDKVALAESLSQPKRNSMDDLFNIFGK